MNKKPYIAPSFKATAFNCPWCKAFAHQTWGPAGFREEDIGHFGILTDYYFSTCVRCDASALWVKTKLVYPGIVDAPLPNEDMEENIQRDFEEAREISWRSPRGAAALLRLCIQNLCKQLGKKGENINDDIGELVRDGMDPRIQEALDIVRVVGNEAVHPGELDLRDDKGTVLKLFELVNFIAENKFTKPKEVTELYKRLIPEEKKKAIEKRDGTGREG